VAAAGPAGKTLDQNGETPKDVGELVAIETKFKQAAAQTVKCVVAIQMGPVRGSGVIVSPEGLILTAGHVARKPGTRAMVTTSDGRSFKAISLGICFSADAGMMKIVDKGKWPCLPLAADGETHVGDWCLAVGHPLGYQEGRPPVVRMGRVIRVEQRATQTDCPLIVGDSGGPLVNLDGKLIGINSRISAPLSMNYHVPIEVFRLYWDRLRKGEVWADGTLRDAGRVKAVFRKVVAESAQCVVRIRCDGKDVVLGTIVGPDGWVLTKASELRGRVVVRLADGRDLEARIIGVNPRFDLAMLKIDAVDLPRIAWGLKDPEVGQWVAVPGLGGDPLAVGVVSVPRRPIPPPKGLLGVTIMEVEKKVVIAEVISKGPADKAGLKKDDVIAQINGHPVTAQKELTEAMTRLRPGSTVRLTIRRGEETLEKSVTLGMLVTPATKKRDDLNAMGIGVSRRHDDFPIVLQHDAAVRPTDCGSPLVTLDGKVVGINVARGGRTETYCVPTNALVVLMYDLMSGRLRPTPSAQQKPADDKKPDAAAKPEDQKKPLEPEKKEEPQEKKAQAEKPRSEAESPAPKTEPKTEPKPEPKPGPKEEPKPEAKPAAKTEPKRLSYVAGSTVKVCQLTGDEDRQTHQPTLSLTAARAGVAATDLGSSFEHQGRLFFLFGDTWRKRDGSGAAIARDAVAWTTSRDPNQIKLDFLRGPDGKWLPLDVPGVSLGPFEVPTGGVSIGGKMFVALATGHRPPVVCSRSVLAVSDDDGKTFRQVYQLSDDKFRVAALVKSEPWLYVFGSGKYRASSVWLARVELDRILDRGAIRYFCHAGADGQPRWSDKESDAAALFQHDVVGEHSVAYCPSVGRYVMLYNSIKPRGIAMRSAPQPWGPWSELEIVFHPWKDKGYGHFMHEAGWFGSGNDRLSDPGRSRTWGGEYGPYLMGRYTTGDSRGCRIYYTMSTWNPYQVVVMRTDLRMEPAPAAAR